MSRIVRFIPIGGIIVFMIVVKLHSDTGILRLVTAIILAADAAAIYFLQDENQASPIHKGMAGFILLTTMAVWVWPAGAGELIVQYPASALYIVLFLVAVGPPFLGREVFTMFFARKTAPMAVWKTDVFVKINHHLTGMWAFLFLLGALLGLVPKAFDLRGALYPLKRTDIREYSRRLSFPRRLETIGNCLRISKEK